MRYINQKPFPVDWRGQLYGNVKGRGGPLTHFVVDESDVTFHDAHVPGATTHATGKGELDILFPAFTAFHHFDVNAASVDLRIDRVSLSGVPAARRLRCRARRRSTRRGSTSASRTRTSIIRTDRASRRTSPEAGASRTAIRS